ncbi:MAG: isocitrate/isopropylmalate dehydrogenase family protein [Thermoleophilia bacterium]
MKVVCLPGDGIGGEVMAEAIRCVNALVPDATVEEHLLGAAAIRQTGDPLPPATLAACLKADAVLMGAVGSDAYAWGDGINPEDGMFRLRRELDVFANLRPSHGDGIDLLIVRELVGGLYFGSRGVEPDGTVYDRLEYHPDQVRRVVRRGFELAAQRGGRMTSVDKANVLTTSRMWRREVDAMAPEYPGVRVDHLLVDTAAMRLVEDPGAFDVIVTENTFGDILSDIAAALTGGLGVAASACVGDAGVGLFEPVHGTAPDIAGRGVANPTAMLLSTALMFRYGLGLPAAADALEDAVAVARSTSPTTDEGGSATTRAFGDRVVQALGAAGAASL